MPEHPSEWAATRSIASKIGCTTETLRKWVRRAERDAGWAILLSDGTQFQTDFGQMFVRAGDRIGLAFIQDVDRDGLTAQEEFLYGSSDFERDTDDDLLDDFVEVRIGWDVGVLGQPLRQVVPYPRRADSDGDGLSDFEESDFRSLQCACARDGPRALYGATGTPCADSDTCGAGVLCEDTVDCDYETVLSGGDCPPRASDSTLTRTDPRRDDTDSDGVSDADEVFGYKTGAGIADVAGGKVAIAGPDLTADTLARPQSHCADDTSQH